MRKTISLLIGALLALSSCSDSDKRPSVFLSETQMIDVMTDAYLIEAQLNMMRSEGEAVSEMQKAYYGQLYEHYGITDSIFEQNMAYYTRHPVVLERIMDSVTNRFAMAQQ